MAKRMRSPEWKTVSAGTSVGNLLGPSLRIVYRMPSGASPVVGMTAVFAGAGLLTGGLPGGRVVGVLVGEREGCVSACAISTGLGGVLVERNGGPLGGALAGSDLGAGIWAAA